MRNIFLSLLCSFLFFACSSESPEIEIPDLTMAEVEARLYDLASIDYDYEQAEEIHQYLDSLKRARQHPVTEGDSVLFVHFGAGETVEWIGDFNGWGQDESIPNSGSQIGFSKIWLWKTSFPSDSRLDYKIRVNGDRVLEDPYNLYSQQTGFSTNSELRMTDYEADPIIEFRIFGDKGELSENKLIISSKTESGHHYRVYTPHNYEKLDDLPVIYVTDGQDYSDQRLGKMTITLDNLIADGKIEPIIAVFVDPRLPENETINRRADFLPINEAYLSFFVDELIPTIESQYDVRSDADGRAILGTSLGGINSTYFAFKRPDVFGNTAIQSPAYWFRRMIYDVVEESRAENLEIFMSSGTFNDGLEMALQMKDLIEEKGMEVNFMQVNEGHTWGAWAPQLDNALIQFFGK